MAISEKIKGELGEQIQKARFLSVMTDSATDVGVREVEDEAKAPGITEAAVNSARLTSVKIGKKKLLP